MQRPVQFENNRTGSILRHERNVCAGAQRVLVGIQLDLDAIVSNVVARSGNGLRAGGRSKRADDNCQRQIATGEKTWSKHSSDRISRISDEHYSSTYHLPASAGRLATLDVVLDGRNAGAVGCLLCENHADVVGLPLSVRILVIKRMAH